MVGFINFPGGIVMSGLRSLEMQVALPRTQTAGKIQDQMQQRSLVVQDQLAQSEQSQHAKRQSVVTEAEWAEKNRMGKDDEQEKHRQNDSHHSNKKLDGNNQVMQVQHPYKGIRFDASW